MGGAPYKSVKEGGGCSFECLTMKERQCHVYSNLMPSKQTNNNIKWNCHWLQCQGLTAQQHSEQHQDTMCMV